MTTLHVTPNVEAARTELERLVGRRARRTKVTTVAGCLIVGVALLGWPVVASGNAVVVVGLFGGLAFIVWGLVVALGVLQVSGERSRYQHDRISYLQAYVAAHDAAATMPPRARGSQPKPRPALPPTVATKPRTVETRPPTVETLVERF